MAENFFGLTDTGKVRDNNEDAFIAKKVLNNKFIIACAIDGVGGYSGGEIAAEIARESIFENFANPSGDLISAMKASFVLANQKIIAEKLQTKEHSKMACVLTLAVVDVANNQFHYAHVGDTRLYLLRDSSLVKVSKDHSFVGFLEDSGRIDEAAAMSHLKRNEINKALGFGTDIDTQDDYIETGTSPFLSGDMLLLCSDGLTDMVNKEQITAVLIANSSLEEKASALVAIANKNGGKDNITVVLVQNDSTSSWQATQPNGANITSTKPLITPAPTDISIEEKKKLTPVIEPTAMSDHKPAVTNASQSTQKSGNKSITPILLVLCALLLASTLYFFWKSTESKQAIVEPVIPVLADNRNPQEIKLQDAINALAGDTLILSDSVYTQPIILTDTLSIGQDTLYIMARGKIILKSDSSFKGPAIQLLDQSKFIMLDGLTFENFDLAISSQNDALVLRNVLFLNCTRAIQNFIAFPEGKPVTIGKSLANSKPDSIKSSKIP
ncbi:MAG: serine/threonine-protein phosphatase [Pyrinomonadaceae bacterium]|nr:serine/threonine-protein phosphatase [Sphingobacteriaceae bacterium]